MVVKLSQNVVGRFDRLTCVSPPFSAFGVSKMNFDSPLSDFSRSRLLRLDDDMMTSEQQPQDGELSLCRLERGREKTEGVPRPRAGNLARMPADPLFPAPFTQ